MSAYNNEYKQSLAVAENPGIRQAEQLAFDECSERLRKKCHERGAKVSVERGDTSEAQKEACDESIPWMIFSRRACSTKNQPTKSEEVLRLYSAEDACLDKMRQILMSRVTSSNSDKALFLEEFTAEEDAANFQGAYEKLRSTTDLVPKHSNLDSTSSTSVAVGLLLNEHAAILEDFFCVCQLPNEAEAQMLGTVSGMHPAVVNMWFAEKRKENMIFFNARARVFEKGRVGALLRMQRDMGSEAVPGEIEDVFPEM